MKKITLLFFISFLFNSVCAQEIYFLTGKNYTSYQLKYEGSSNVNPLEKRGNGDSYEIGFAIPIKVQRLNFDNNFNYTIGLTLNQHNANAGDGINNFVWDTDYVGLKNSLVFSFIKTNKLDLAVRAGVNAATLLQGSQTINNSRFDLKDQKDFNGFVLFPAAGLQAKCNLSEYGYLSLSYNYSKSFSLTNKTDKKLTMTTNQILFGISFELY